MALDHEHAESHLDTGSRERLRQIIARIERLEEEKAALVADIRDIYKEAKASGYDAKALRKTVRLRRKPRREREQEEAICELYLSAVEPQ